jgi:hypothetical protein
LVRAPAPGPLQQHVLDDGVCALAVLHHLVEIVAQGIRQFGYFGERITFRDSWALP